MKRDVPRLEICRIELYRDDLDDNPIIVDDPQEVWRWIDELKRDFRSRIEIVYEEVDGAFVVRVIEDQVGVRQMYEMAKAEAIQTLLVRGNKIGRRWMDDEGSVWYG